MRELKEFGTGHLLYFYWLVWNALLFSTLFLLAGLPQVVANGLGSFYDSADFDAVTLGNYGLISSNKAYELSSSGSSMSRESEAAMEALFRNDTFSDPATISWLGAQLDKAKVNQAMSIVDLCGCVLKSHEPASQRPTATVTTTSHRHCHDHPHHH